MPLNTAVEALLVLRLELVAGSRGWAISMRLRALAESLALQRGHARTR